MKPDVPLAQLNHPSFLALDRARLGSTSEEMAAHLEACENCRVYLESLVEPDFVPSLTTLRRTVEPSRRRVRWDWLLASTSLALAACCVFLFVARRDPGAPQIEDPYIAAKGFRSVWIYVRRGTETRLWDGKEAVAPGDRVRLKIDACTFHRVQVYSSSDPQKPILLFESALSPGQQMTLPDAWEIDDSPAAERLFVVFSDVPVSPRWNEWRRGVVQPGIAVLPFVLPKFGVQGADAGPLTP